MGRRKDRGEQAEGRKKDAPVVAFRAGCLASRLPVMALNPCPCS